MNLNIALAQVKKQSRGLPRHEIARDKSARMVRWLLNVRTKDLNFILLCNMEMGCN